MSARLLISPSSSSTSRVRRCAGRILTRRRPRRAHHLQAPSQATSKRPNASGVRLSSSSEYCVSSKVLEGDQRQRRPSIVVDVRTARKQALPGQSSYMARKTKLLHGTVIERRKTTKEKDLLPSMIILRRGDGVESSPTCWPAALPSSRSCLGCCLARHRPSRSLGSCDRLQFLPA